MKTSFHCYYYLIVLIGLLEFFSHFLPLAMSFLCSWLKLCFKRTKAKTMRRKCGHCYRKACREVDSNFFPCDLCNLRNWLENYDLNDVNAFSLFNEFLEMGVYLSVTYLQHKLLTCITSIFFIVISYLNCKEVFECKCDCNVAMLEYCTLTHAVLPCVISSSVQFHHHLCGCVSSGSFIGSHQ